MTKPIDNTLDHDLVRRTKAPRPEFTPSQAEMKEFLVDAEREVAVEHALATVPDANLEDAVNVIAKVLGAQSVFVKNVVITGDLHGRQFTLSIGSF